MKHLKSFISSPFTLAFLLITNLFFSFYLFPKAHQPIRVLANNPNYQTLDVRFGYDKTYVLQLFEDLTENGKYLYSKIELGIDMIFPALYSCLLISLILALSKNYQNSRIRLLAIIPIFTAFFDYLENFSVVVLIQTPIHLISEKMVLFCSICTMSKLSTLYFSVLIILVLGVVSFLKNIQKSTMK